MSRRHLCPQCGAPHRLNSVETRFRCDYCQALVECRVDTEFEIWQLGVAASPGEAKRFAERWLAESEIHGARITVDAPQWASHWQMFSQAGEEFRAEASRFEHPLLAQLSLPATARTDDLATLPEPRIARSEAECAALASFRDADATLATVRLLHQPVVPLRLTWEGESVPALLQVAERRMLVASLPAAAHRVAAVPQRMLAYAVFVAMCLALGGAVAAPPWRLLAMAALFAVGLLAWRPLTGRRP